MAECMYNYRFQTRKPGNTSQQSWWEGWIYGQLQRSDKGAQEHQPAELVGGLDLTPGRGEFTQHNQAWGKEWEDPLK